MSHETDLYEVNDREPSEPEPCDWYPANEPVDLDKLRIRTADSVVIRDWEPIANERPF